MSFFSNFLNLGSTIARNVSGLGDDVFKTKKALGGLGLFSGAVNATPDSGLFDSLKAFQKSAGLSVDGLMKPGGPTERGLNSLLQQTGVGERVFSEKAPGQGTDKLDKPSPWFKQAGLPQISAEASSSNGRTVGGLMKSSANGKLPLYQADALFSNKDRAFGEYGDFLNQLHARDPGRVAGFEKDVMERLPSATKAKLTTYFNQTAKAKPARLPMRSLLSGDGGKDELSGAAAKPTAPAQQTENPDTLPIPAYRKQAKGLQGTNWKDWSSSVGKLKGGSDAERNIYKNIYAAEGGLATDPISGAASGISKNTLDRAIKGGVLPGLKEGTIPDKLSIDQRAKVYRHYFDDALRTVDRTVPGSGNLQKIGDAKASSAFADTLFAHGRSGGAEAIQKAINKVTPNSVEDQGQMGPKTFKAYKKLSANPQTRRALLNALADVRLKMVKEKTDSVGWRPRIDNFRP